MTIEQALALDPQTVIPRIEGTLKVVKAAEQEGGKYPGLKQWGVLADGGHEIQLNCKDNVIPQTWQGQRMVISSSQSAKGINGVKLNEWTKRDGTVVRELRITQSAKIALAGTNGAQIEHRAAAPSRAPSGSPAHAANPGAAQPRSGALTVEGRVEVYFRILGAVASAFRAAPAGSLPELGVTDLKDIATHISIDAWRAGVPAFREAQADPATTTTGAPPAAKGKVPWREVKLKDGRTLNDIAELAEGGNPMRLYEMGAWAYRTAEDGTAQGFREAVFEAMEEIGVGVDDLCDDVLCGLFKGNSAEMAEYVRSRHKTNNVTHLPTAAQMAIIKDPGAVEKDIAAWRDEIPMVAAPEPADAEADDANTPF